MSAFKAAVRPGAIMEKGIAIPMKATGIVRRIDDLGRVVIPKEIRRTMRIREGEPLEIFTDAAGGVVFKKYSPMGELSAIAGQLCEALNKSTGHPCVICDRDSVIAASGAGKLMAEGHRLTKQLEQVMEARQQYLSADKGVEVCEGGSIASLVIPVITEGDLAGCVAMVQGNEPLGDAEVKAAHTAAIFMARQMEA